MHAELGSTYKRFFEEFLVGPKLFLVCVWSLLQEEVPFDWTDTRRSGHLWRGPNPEEKTSAAAALLLKSRALEYS